MSFRPRIGDYFLSKVIRRKEKANKKSKFSSPYWRLFFYLPKNEDELSYITKDGFRPCIGDYFFIKSKSKLLTLIVKFSFRPRIGDYFFICTSS